MNLWWPIGFALLGCAIVCALTPLIIKDARRRRLGRNLSDFHHTHNGYVPRLGGLALVLAFISVELCIALFQPGQRDRTLGRNVVFFSSLAMFTLGFIDDLRPLGARKKLAGQVLIAFVVWFLGIGIEQFRLPFTNLTLELNAWSAVLTVFWLVGMTNLLNLIDGIDGVAGGIALMLMGLLAFIGHQGGNFELLSAGMAGALLGFLRFNFPPARVYLGDGGAYFLGFQIGLISLVNCQKGTVFAALVAPLFVLALPIVDTTLAILRRGMKGLPIFRADQRHIHHRLLRSGFSRRQVVIGIYGITLVFLVLGLGALWKDGRFMPALLGVGVLILLVCAGQLRFSREWFSVGRVVGNSLEMRQEIQYALCLTRWLALEGRRSPSVQALWEDLVFCAKKMGFTTVKLKLADGEQVWQSGTEHLTKIFHHELHGGRLGSLELRAPIGLSQEQTRESSLPRPDASATENLFEILSELLAEGWMKAAVVWQDEARTALRFDSESAGPASGSRRGAFAFLFSFARKPALKGLSGPVRQIKA